MKLASSSREAMQQRGDLVSTETGGNVWDLSLSPPGSEGMGWGSQDLIGLLPAQPSQGRCPSIPHHPSRPQKPSVLPKPCLHLSLFILRSSGDLEAAVRGSEICPHCSRMSGVQTGGRSCLVSEPLGREECLSAEWGAGTGGEWNKVFRGGTAF